MTPTPKFGVGVDLVFQFAILKTDDNSRFLCMRIAHYEWAHANNLMKISTRSQYGLRAMVYLAGCHFKNTVCPLKKISQDEDISFDYLEKIILKLEKAGFVKAKKGVQGGYFLVRSPKKIKIGEIIRALEGEMTLVKCLPRIPRPQFEDGAGRGIAKKGRYFCPRERKCLTKSFWKKVQEALNSALNSLTLADLINPEGPRPRVGGRAYEARK